MQTGRSQHCSASSIVRLPAGIGRVQAALERSILTLSFWIFKRFVGCICLFVPRLIFGSRFSGWADFPSLSIFLSGFPHLLLPSSLCTACLPTLPIALHLLTYFCSAVLPGRLLITHLLRNYSESLISIRCQLQMYEWVLINELISCSSSIFVAVINNNKKNHLGPKQLRGKGPLDLQLRHWGEAHVSRR